MKTTIALILVIIIFVSANYQEGSDGMAKVHIIRGREVYVMCDPIRPYTVVDKVKTFNKITESVYDRIEGYVIASKYHDEVEFDAILVDHNRGASLIKWKD